MKKTISIGSQSFKYLREEDLFYIDKTDFIREWWENKDIVTLITRLRRFGKTLNLDMMECFFLRNMRIERICLRAYPFGKMSSITNCKAVFL